MAAPILIAMNTRKALAQLVVGLAALLIFAPLAPATQPHGDVI